MKLSRNGLLRRFQNIPPGQALILYYAAATLIGTAFLSLPMAVHEAPLTFIDALFTATSAQCVTGLVVVDTGTRFTLFGQLVILALIQTGGLGITTFSVYLFFYFRMGVGLRGRWIIQETLLHTPVESLKDLIRSVVSMTLVIEGIGMLLLSLAFVPDLGLSKGLYFALFHSVSAFCNAGFALFPDSLIPYQSSIVVNFTIMGLIVSGGIGFLVIREILHLRKAPSPRRRLSLHTRLVLWTTGILIVGGFLLILLIDYQTLERHGWRTGLLVALFQSVTARTAGFNTINLNLLEVPSLVLIMFLMFIGASPGSAGGGIKTTSLALFVAILQSRLQGNRNTNVFHRTIPDELVTKALSLVLLAALFVGLSVFCLLLAQSTDLPATDSRGAFLDYVFEAVSALATVGLSLGATEKLLPLSKVIIILLMFVGRVGILTIAFTIVRRSQKNPVRFSEENIMIG